MHKNRYFEFLCTLLPVVGWQGGTCLPPKHRTEQRKTVAWLYIQGSDNTVLGRQPGMFLSAPTDASSPPVKPQATPQGAIHSTHLSLSLFRMKVNLYSPLDEIQGTSYRTFIYVNMDGLAYIAMIMFYQVLSSRFLLFFFFLGGGG